MATIKEVAKTAMVSPATVSRVLNNNYSVKADTREKVIKTMQDLNYQPNHFSRNLRRQHSRMLLILVPDFGNPFYGDILDGMDMESRLCGYNLLQVSTYFEQSREREAISWLESKQAAGAVFMAPSLNGEAMDQLAKRYAIVQCCEYNMDSSVAHVSIDNYAAAYQAMDHLIRLGHKRIAMFSSINKFISTTDRERAYRAALFDNDIPYDDSLLIRGDYSFESGVTSAGKILHMENRPTAIMAISDTVAAGAIRSIMDAELRIPGDMAVIGFDNIELARMVTPPLSTVAQPRRLLGKTAIQMLVGMLEDTPIQSEIFLPFEIILRKSTL